METSDQILFIYDALVILKEEDDPAEAIVYFYPSHMPAESQIKLCNTLISLMRGMAKVMGQIPDIIKLQERKFSLVEVGKYVMVFGSQTDDMSDFSASKMLQYILEVMLNFYPDIDFLLQNINCTATLDELLGFMIQKHWTRKEFDVVPFFNCQQVAETVMLKCVNISDYCCHHDGIFGCSLLHKGSILYSNMSQKMTKLGLTAAACEILGKKLENIKGFSCKSVTVNLSEDSFQKLARTKRQKYGDFDIDPLTQADDSFDKEEVEWCISDLSDKTGEHKSEQFERDESETGSVFSEMDDGSWVNSPQPDCLPTGIPSSGSAYDTASNVSDYLPHESSSDEVFDAESNLLVQSSSQISFGASSFSDEHYITASNDLCQFLDLNSAMSSTQPKYLHHADIGIKKCRPSNKVEPVPSTKFGELCNSNDVELTSGKLRTLEEKESTAEAALSSSRGKLEFVICSDGVLAFILLLEKSSAARTHGIVRRLLDGCQRDLQIICSELNQSLEYMEPEITKQRSRYIHYTSAVGKMEENEDDSSEDSSSSTFRKSVTTGHDIFTRMPTLQKMSLQGGGPAFHVERSFDSTSFTLEG